MAQKSLNRFIEVAKKAWGPLNSATVANFRSLMEALTQAPDTQVWLTERLQDTPGYAELYRDPEAGFVLLAYREKANLYRVPHDHGDGWVIYSVVSGEMDMGTYLRTINQQGQVELVKRDLVRMKAGACHVYLPGDIHDTRSLSDSDLLLRFTSCDLDKEDSEGRLIRYLDQGTVIEKEHDE